MDTSIFATLPLAANLTLFGLAAALVWISGLKLAGYAKTIAERTGAEQAFVGVLLLGAVVSLPEMATTVSAAALGNARLAVSTLLGGVAATMAILAITDAVTGKEALSSDVSHPVVLLQGVLVVLFLVIAASGMVVGDTAVAGVGLWTTALFVLYILFILLVKRYAHDEPWVVRDKHGEERAPHGSRGQRTEQRSTVKIYLLTAAAAIAILLSGFLLAVSGEALADQTGLGASFVGMLLGGVATSLPEVTTTVAAVRLAQYEMAFGDAFGTNLFSVMLLFVADLAYTGKPILNEVDRFSLFATLLGIVLTAVYLAGLIERRDKSVLGVGIDSLIVLTVYVGGLFLLLRLR